MIAPNELLPEYDLDYRKARPNRFAGQIDWDQDVIVLDHESAPDAGSTATLDDRDEYPEVTQADLDRATFRIGLKISVPSASYGKPIPSGDPVATMECGSGEPSTKNGA